MLSRFIFIIIALLINIAAFAQTKVNIELTADNALVDNSKQITNLSGHAKVLVINSNSKLDIKGDLIVVNHAKQRENIIEITGTNSNLANFCHTKQASNEDICGKSIEIKYFHDKRELHLISNAVLYRYVNKELKDTISGNQIIYNELQQTYSVQSNSSKQNNLKDKKTEQVKITITVD